MLRGSTAIATIAGIPIRVHWTFAALLLWIFASGAMHGGTIASGAVSAAFTVGVFGCVVLHELGHALAARRYGVHTRDITLLPIGGVATLERIPENPLQEFVIAVAGPLVNVVIAASLFTGLIWREGMEALLAVEKPGFHIDHFLAALAAVNVWLVFFNMIPAFPMDGGRVLRAILAAGLGRARATRVAATVGQGLAVVMAVVGVFVSPMLILVALFVWMSAGAEAREAERQSLVAGLPVSAAMLTQFRALAPNDSLGAAAHEIMTGTQRDFPVTATGEREADLLGVLTRDDLVSALRRQGAEAFVVDAMRRDVPIVQATDPLGRAIESMRSNRCSAMPVMRENRLVGLITSESIAELVALRSAGVDLSPA